MLSDLLSTNSLTLILINMGLAWAMWLPLSVGQFAFSTAGSAATGAYVAAKFGLSFGTPIVVGLLLALVAGALFGVLPGIMATRLKGFSFALATLALAEVVRVTIVTLPGLGGAYGLVGIATSDAVLPIAALVVVAVAVLSHFVYRSHTGRLFDVLAGDELLATGLGSSTRLTKVAVLALASGVAAVGGGLMASYTGYLSPDLFGLAFTTQMFAYVIVGGIATYAGPLVGAAVLTIALQIFASTAGAVQNIIFGALLIVAILVRRDGLLWRSKRLQRRRLEGLVRRVSTTGGEGS